jgi:hypothetical protein
MSATEFVMAAMVNLIRKWKASYQVLHYRNGFGFFASVRYGLWLARS